MFRVENSLFVCEALRIPALVINLRKQPFLTGHASHYPILPLLCEFERHAMEELTLTTPALLFSAISLIMLAYTNRFLAYAAVVRSLKDQFLEKMDDSLLEQIHNLKLRLNLTRYMQIMGITSLLLCVLTMLLIYIDFHVFAVWIFGFALLLLISSLTLLIREIQISTHALGLHLRDIENHLAKIEKDKNSLAKLGKSIRRRSKKNR
jgi:hypothetical protein